VALYCVWLLESPLGIYRYSLTLSSSLLIYLLNVRLLDCLIKRIYLIEYYLTMKISVCSLVLISNLLVIGSISCVRGTVSDAELDGYLLSICEGYGKPNAQNLLICSVWNYWKIFNAKCQVATANPSISTVCQVQIKNQQTQHIFPSSILPCSGGCPANSACTVDPTFTSSTCTSLVCLPDICSSNGDVVSVSTCQLLTTTTTTTQTTTSATASLRP